MISLSDFRVLYLASCVLLGLIIVGPTLALVVSFPGGEHFSELYLLGPGHMAEGYPFNVRSGIVYNVSLGVVNHIGGLQYYMVYVKFRNQTEPLPNATAGTPSSLEPLTEFHLFLSDIQTWEKFVGFALETVSFEGNFCKVSGLSINSHHFSIEKIAAWDQINRGFYCQLFFELWIYNATASSFEFHNRFVGNWLNVTRNS